MTARERVARSWHEGSDHADHSPFGGPLCNCMAVAGRMLPMLSEVWRIGYAAGMSDEEGSGYGDFPRTPNPYPYEEDRHE